MIARNRLAAVFYHDVGWGDAHDGTTFLVEVVDLPCGCEFQYFLFEDDLKWVADLVAVCQRHARVTR